MSRNEDLEIALSDTSIDIFEVVDNMDAQDDTYDYYTDGMGVSRSHCETGDVESYIPGSGFEFEYNTDEEMNSASNLAGEYGDDDYTEVNSQDLEYRHGDKAPDWCPEGYDPNTGTQRGLEPSSGHYVNKDGEVVRDGDTPDFDTLGAFSGFDYDTPDFDS